MAAGMVIGGHSGARSGTQARYRAIRGNTEGAVGFGWSNPALELATGW
jgi:hypothetical protein